MRGNMFIILFALFLTELSFAHREEEDNTIPKDLDKIIKEISRHEICFQNRNCTQCLYDPSCIWTNKGTVTAKSNNTLTEVRRGGICWSGGFMSRNDKHFHINVTSEYKVDFSTSKARVHSLSCTGVSDAGILAMIVVFPIVLTTAFTFIFMASLNVERIGFYEKI